MYLNFYMFLPRGSWKTSFLISSNKKHIKRGSCRYYILSRRFDKTEQVLNDWSHCYFFLSFLLPRVSNPEISTEQFKNQLPSSYDHFPFSDRRPRHSLFFIFSLLKNHVLVPILILSTALHIGFTSLTDICFLEH